MRGWTEIQESKASIAASVARGATFFLRYDGACDPLFSDDDDSVIVEAAERVLRSQSWTVLVEVARTTGLAYRRVGAKLFARGEAVRLAKEFGYV